MDLLEFEEMLPDDVLLLAPGTYQRFHLLNHCIMLSMFNESASGHESCEGVGGVFEERVELVRNILKALVSPQVQTLPGHHEHA
ncbi:hypothetical protein RHVP.67a [Cricetid gammaherpesvirus 2]|uniref:Tripartite terminase subunit 2 n=1 Tax=Cricetid gammaherpesvirus 2 TaxID=1605972 RepID=E9M5Q1_9GAMA|nr:hypothetical protein RHVP.67a [Cricetid gammaherpesvirus 2]ADW24409.1 hypothetical protein RHVP.67a [Cricetid gammaherpesvirus 2]ADW24491.1 hypothetical protein RHVP-L.67a [Cricetid gammaherpesvirus 2]